MTEHGGEVCFVASHHTDYAGLQGQCILNSAGESQRSQYVRAALFTLLFVHIATWVT